MEQHAHTWWGWLNHHWAFISLVCFPAFMCYLNSFAIFFKIMGATQLADFLGKLEEALTAAVAAGKAYKQQATKVVIFILVLPMLTSCASGGMNSTCAHISGSEMTVPYIGGKGNADVYACHMGYIGFAKGPQPSYSDLEKLTEEYLKNTGEKISTTGPGTITFTPTAK